MKLFSIITITVAIALLQFAPACAQDKKPTTSTETIETAAGSSFTVESQQGVDARFDPVIKELVARGWNEDTVRRHFSDSRTVFIPKMVNVGIKKSGKGKNHYTWVNTQASVEACQTFIDTYRTALEEAESKYGVDKETIAALMRVETQHGKITGDYHVFSVYASMALLDESEYLEANFDRARDQLGKAKKSVITSQLNYIENRSRSRAKWALKELENMLKMEKKGFPDVLSIFGSWAGAFGWSQFLPSSYLLRAVDGDGDGRADLFNPVDAIHSVANYLDKAGFQTTSTTNQRKAIRNYNNSTDYVNSIIALAARLRAS